MELDAFTSRLGETQGRIVTPDAEVMFVLGDLNSDRFFELAPGDHVEVRQQTDLSGVTFVRARLTLRVPSGLTSGLAWEVSVLVDGTKRARATGLPGRTRPLDLSANVSKLAGLHDVGVRLELVAV